MKKIFAKKRNAIYLLLWLSLLLPAAVWAQESVSLVNPLRESDPTTLIGNIIKSVLGLTGVISLVAFIAGGIIWMTSGGSAEKVKKGRDILVWAVIGLFVAFSSYTILRYVFEALT